MILSGMLSQYRGQNVRRRNARALIKSTGKWRDATIQEIE